MNPSTTQSTLEHRSTLMPRPLTILLFMVLAAATANAHGVTRYTNGQWLENGSFTDATFYSVDGVLRAEHDGPVDTTVDLDGGFVVPPLADAHTHALGDSRFSEMQVDFLAKGIFYATNPNSLSNQTAPIRPEARKPETVDVIYANGGLTSSGGHPIQIYDRAADHTPGIEREDMAGKAYFAIDTLEDLRQTWPEILAGKPDFIKVYLEESEHHASRKDDESYYGRRGIDPALLPPIVERAHQAGLRVAVHVASAYDARIAIESGVDELAHLPLEPIDESLARLAAERSVTVVTTTLSHRPSRVDDLQKLHQDNLRLLKKHGVRLVLGTDSERGLLTELQNVAELLALDNKSAIELATADTSRWIFPERKIGALDSGFEASFLVLESNPLDDLSAFEHIKARVKAGHAIEIESKNQKPSIAQALMNTIMSSGVDVGIEEYRKLRRESPDAYDFSEPQLNSLGYAMIQHGQVEGAIAIFELNVEMFPKAYNAYDSLGEAMMTAGRRDEAIASYERSLELNPENQNAREKLAELGEP